MQTTTPPTAATAAGAPPMGTLDEAQRALAENRPDTAAVILRDLVRRDPTDATTLALLGRACLETGANFEAEDALSHALEVDGGDEIETRALLARACVRLGMFERALRILDSLEARGAAPQDAPALSAQARQGLAKMTLYPRYVSIESASVCNAHCHFCPTPQVKREPFMPEEVWKKIIDDNREAGIEIRMNMDGDPLCNRDLPDIIRYVKETTNCTITFNTNGGLLDEKMGRAILDAGIDGIRFSIDGIRKDTYEANRAGVNYNRMLANVVTYLNLRERLEHPSFVEVRLIRLPNNESERDAFTTFWSSFPRVKVIHTTPYYWPSTGKEGIRKPCFRGADDFELYYFTDGRATLCCMDWKEKAVLGDARKYSTREIWNGPLALTWRRHLRDGDRHLIPLCAECNQDLSVDAVFDDS